MLEVNNIYCIDNIQGMKLLDNNSIDLTVTSPPYSDIRDYNKFQWNFEYLVKELYRTTKDGGVVVWVVGDKTAKGTEELVPFVQCLYFHSIGFNVWDTMIYEKNNCPFPSNVRYNQLFEFMFIFSKGKVKTFNPIKIRKSEKEIEKILNGKLSVESKSYRDKDGNTKRADSEKNMLNRIKKSATNTEKTKGNVWQYNSGYMVGSKDKETFEHPASFPESLAEDHILSWSNPDDLVFDPFMGSGTTAKMAKLNNRKYLGFELSKEYCDIAEKRLSKIR
jgi:site-specific DNA-methyltransferase (adenine-specific)